MPRIYDGESNPHDFCRRHYPKTEEAARRIYGRGEGPDGRGNCFGYDAEHPDYEGEDYHCDIRTCRKVLTERDN